MGGGREALESSEQIRNSVTFTFEGSFPIDIDSVIYKNDCLWYD